MNTTIPTVDLRATAEAADAALARAEARCNAIEKLLERMASLDDAATDDDLTEEEYGEAFGWIPALAFPRFRDALKVAEIDFLTKERASLDAWALVPASPALPGSCVATPEEAGEAPALVDAAPDSIPDHVLAASSGGYL